MPLKKSRNSFGLKYHSLEFSERTKPLESMSPYADQLKHSDSSSNKSLNEWDEIALLNHKFD